MWNKLRNFQNIYAGRKDGWALVEGQTNVYARKVESADIGTSYSVLKNDQVTVKGKVTKEMMTTAQTSKPTLTVTA